MNNKTAVVKQIADHYYELKMGDRDMGGTNKQSLINYAHKQGYQTVHFIPQPRRESSVFRIHGRW